MKISIGPVFLTGMWLVGCAVCLLVIQLFRGRAKWDYRKYAVVRTVLGTPFALFAIFCLYWFWKLEVFAPESEKVTFNDWTTATVAFWTLFPPIWFFLEYMAIEFKVFKNSPNQEVVKTYADLASKIWAAFLAIYVALLAQRYQATEAVNKKSEARYFGMPAQFETAGGKRNWQAAGLKI